MKKLLAIAAVGLALALPAAAQNYTGVPTLATNFMNSAASITTASSPVVAATPKATLWVQYQVVTNTVGSGLGPGTGVVSFVVGCSQSATAGPYVNVTPYAQTPYTQSGTNAPLTLTQTYTGNTNGNIVTGYLSFDASGMNGLVLNSMSNTSTNAAITNLSAQFIFRQ